MEIMKLRLIYAIQTKSNKLGLCLGPALSSVNFQHSLAIIQLYEINIKR